MMCILQNEEIILTKYILSNNSYESVLHKTKSNLKRSNFAIISGLHYLQRYGKPPIIRRNKDIYLNLKMMGQAVYLYLISTIKFA